MSDLEDSALEAMYEELSGRSMQFHRFQTLDDARHYMKRRRDAEAKVRKRFVAKGGRPVLGNPRFLVLGTSKWFDGWYIETEALRIPLEHFPKDIISFTYPDCLISTILGDSPRWEKKRKPYHGEVYTLEEIRGVIAEHGMPDEDNPARFEIDEHLVEAQIWDMGPLQSYQKAK